MTSSSRLMCGPFIVLDTKEVTHPSSYFRYSGASFIYPRSLDQQSVSLLHDHQGPRLP